MMALITVLSASGAPGCTTTAVGLALRWRRPVLLVEADTSGPAVLAGIFQGQLAPERGLVQVAISYGQEELTDLIWQQAITLPGGTEASVLTGLDNPTQAASVQHLWGDLAGALTALDSGGVDVIVDLGRLRLPADDRAPLLALSDQILLTTRSSLVDVHIAVMAARILRDKYDAGDTAMSALGTLLINPDAPYSAKEIAKVLEIPAVIQLPFDPSTAATYSHGKNVSLLEAASPSTGARPRFSAASRRARRFHTAPLNRALDSAVSTLTERITTRKVALHGPALGRGE